MLWEAPESDGNSHIHAYKVDWFTPGTTLADLVDFFKYQKRISASCVIYDHDVTILSIQRLFFHYFEKEFAILTLTYSLLHQVTKGGPQRRTA